MEQWRRPTHLVSDLQLETVPIGEYVPEIDPTPTWLCDVTLGGCGRREVWRWSPGTVLCEPCTKRIAAMPYKRLPYTPHPEGMKRGRLTGPIDDKRTDTEHMQVFTRWQKFVNR